MASKPFNDRYCPACLAPVDPETGDHWHYCEYEATYRDWVNPIQPLTRLEMLDRKLNTAKNQIKSLNAQKRQLNKETEAYNEQINKNAS